MRNGVLRAQPDETYADADDSAWMDVDWSALLRPVRVHGRDINVLDTQPATRGSVGLGLTEPAGTGTQPATTGSVGQGPTEPAGTPLLFIHGWSANWQCWLLTIPAFMDAHRCIALDLPGFGFSDMPSDSISINGYARTIDALCAQLGVDSVVVVGNSMGGFIGAELALAYPTRVERLVLVSAAGLSIEHQPRRPLLALGRLVAASYPYAASFQDPMVRRPLLRRAALQFVVRYPEKLSVPLTRELVRGSGKPGFVPALNALLSYSYRERLAEIDIPVLIVWGRNDMLVPVEDAEDYERLIGPNARAVVFEDTGHAPMIERPSRFNELLRGFLAGERAPEAGVTGVSA